MTTSRSGTACLIAVVGELDTPSSSQAEEPRPSFWAGSPKQQHAGESELLRAAGLGDRLAYRKALDAGHRLDRLALSFA